MSNSKSKWPDLKELGDMTGKLFQDIKASVCEIVADYKQKHPSEPETGVPPASEKEADSQDKPEKKQAKSEDD